ncbi:hypothetical protein J2X69_003309 [Algoriphagus sp. 4150]|uniref:hypothetical protein n=1 Tax=Algoriphagus sp. 4150 TaxID=2817756 RepID=UPI00285E1047|nr:hypothetical protein [Algoriphagus sp. 4150]MDR7130950.1 hypothetical protein [Algoriphagus sp. 4150]
MKGLSYFLITWFSFLYSCDFAAGSYPYAEIYEFEVSENKLIETASEFKVNNPDYIVPENVGLFDGRSQDKTDLWYHIWFYYKEENKIIYTWIRGNKLAFVSIGEGAELGGWKRINKDFNRSENKEEKKKFEKRILNKLKESI